MEIAKAKKVVIFPGWFQSVKNYGSYEGVEIWAGETLRDEQKNADFFVGHSAGAAFAIFCADNRRSKFILINPLLERRSAWNLFVRWLKFFLREGIKKKKIIPKKYWVTAIKKIWEIANIDLLSEIKKIPSDNIVIIRGKKDNFFCDEKTVEIIKKNNLKLIEVDAGHDWNKNILEALEKIVNFSC